MQNTTRALAATCLLAPSALAQAIYTTDFDSGIPAEFAVPGGGLTGVQGYAGLGPPGRQFDGQMLQYTSTQVLPTTLTLTALPPHTHVDVQFLLAIIDSWDGVEFLDVRVDGTLIFSHWFDLANTDTSSYVAPPGALLSSGTNLGFAAGTFNDRDRAYDLGTDPDFVGIPHTSSSIVIEWSLSGPLLGAWYGWQGSPDESWAIDELTITFYNATNPVGARYCNPAVPNSTGQPATMSVYGSVIAAQNDVTLSAIQMPLNAFGYFLTSTTQGFVANPAGSDGDLCLSGAIGRFVGAGQIQNASSVGSITLPLDLTSHPTPTGLVSIAPGDTWNFQAWYRDTSATGQPTSNLTDAVQVIFQ